MMNYIEREERVVHFVLAPSNRYVGWIVYNNAYYFGSANRLGRLLHNVNLAVYRLHQNRVKFKLRLASKPTDRKDVPVDKMTDHFKSGSYFNHKITGFLTEDQAETFERMKPKVEPKAEPKVEPKPVQKVNEEFVCEEKDGEMVVFKLVEVARFKLHKGMNDVNSED